ncbi:hypothetical protein AB1Y20_000938 [Prymnesium parvum]|uniref:Uncharacterized protein n=1 Tax=Prymnesium parvum TaxID=97485 RepID=A0AB34K681_PRYPA
MVLRSTEFGHSSLHFMAEDDDDWETDADYENTTSTDAAWLAAKMEASKIVTSVYVPEGPDAPEKAQEEDDAPPLPSYMPSADLPDPSGAPEQLHIDSSSNTHGEDAYAQAGAPPPTEPSKSDAVPSGGKGVAMRFLVPSQAKAPPKLPPN